ncbi:TRAP transporter large permease subunit, partial [Salmonella enterica]|nr:TRAP transporter large permease subunit [Salmonella enterica]
TLVIMLVGLLVLLALRVPVAIALLAPSLAYVLMEPTANFPIAVQQITSGVNDFALLAVPLFIVLGNLANEYGISDRLYNAGVAFLGHI